jgi:hypothetical protein
MDNVCKIQHLLAQLSPMGIRAGDICWHQFRRFLKQLKVEKNAKLPNHIQSAAVNDGIATLLWINSFPVTVIFTIHHPSGVDSLVLTMRKHLGNKSTNTSRANRTYLPGEWDKQLDIPVIVDSYNQHKVSVDVPD